MLSLTYFESQLLIIQTDGRKPLPDNLGLWIILKYFYFNLENFYLNMDNCSILGIHN